MNAQIPPRLRKALATPGRAPRPPDMPLLDFMRLDEHPDDRPHSTGLGEHTAKDYIAHLRQIGREAFDDAHALITGEKEPEWQRILDWRDDPGKGGKARLETQRRALRWLAAWWGYDRATCPPFLRDSWKTKRSLAESRDAGRLRERQRFLRLPTDIQALIAAHPYETRLRGRVLVMRRRALQRARHQDATFRTMVFLAFYTGARPSELATLMLENYQPDRGGIVGWAQPKDHGERRDVVIPETFVWHSKIDASVDHYLTYVRPKVSRAESGEALFLTPTGRPFAPRTAALFIGRTMRIILGPASTGGHGLRRACATYRYHFGWSIHDIAVLLHDSESVIAASYLDWTWLNSPRGEPVLPTKKRPPLPRIRSRA